MGYRIPKVPYGTGWTVKFEDRTGGKRNQKSIPKEFWANIGFRPSMTIDEAKARARELNAQETLKRHEKRRSNIIDRLQTEKTVINGYLPEHLVSEFESQLKSLNNPNGKYHSHWRAAKRSLFAIKLEPTEWYKRSSKFYAYFLEQSWSPSYCDKIISVVNKWGDFVTEFNGQRFKPIPGLKGRERHKIADKYFDKTGGRESLPLEPIQLISRCNDLGPKRYNWLYLSLWLGLRPFEVDSLLKPSSRKTWWLESRAEGKILWVYQTKLIGIAPDKRAKPIPLITPEQLFVIPIIESRNFKRPLCKTIKSYFGEKYTCYAGRKGFTDLMLSKGRKFEDISIWLGHSTIDRTWRNYKDKQRVNFT